VLLFLEGSFLGCVAAVHDFFVFVSHVSCVSIFLNLSHSCLRFSLIGLQSHAHARPHPHVVQDAFCRRIPFRYVLRIHDFSAGDTSLCPWFVRFDLHILHVLYLFAGFVSIES